jgi:hypothetical protein
MGRRSPGEMSSPDRLEHCGEAMYGHACPTYERWSPAIADAPTMVSTPDADSDSASRDSTTVSSALFDRPASATVLSSGVCSAQDPGRQTTTSRSHRPARSSHPAPLSPTECADVVGSVASRLPRPLLADVAVDAGELLLGDLRVRAGEPDQAQQMSVTPCGRPCRCTATLVRSVPTGSTIVSSVPRIGPSTYSITDRDGTSNAVHAHPTPYTPTRTAPYRPGAPPGPARSRHRTPSPPSCRCPGPAGSRPNRAATSGCARRVRRRRPPSTPAACTPGSPRPSGRLVRHLDRRDQKPPSQVWKSVEWPAAQAGSTCPAHNTSAPPDAIPKPSNGRVRGMT